MAAGEIEEEATEGEGVDSEGAMVGVVALGVEDDGDSRARGSYFASSARRLAGNACHCRILKTLDYNDMLQIGVSSLLRFSHLICPARLASFDRLVWW